MQRFIAHENIKRFKEQLRNCPDEWQKETLVQLLAAEEGKLKELKRTCRQSTFEAEARPAEQPES